MIADDEDEPGTIPVTNRNDKCYLSAVEIPVLLLKAETDELPMAKILCVKIVTKDLDYENKGDVLCPL